MKASAARSLRCAWWRALRTSTRTEPTETPTPAAASPPVPRRWWHLDVLGHVASGAFRDVYRAWDPQLDREVALKLLRRAPDADAHADEVVDEGRLLARLRHPHIVSIYGAARIDGRVGPLDGVTCAVDTLAQAVAQGGAFPARKVADIGAASVMRSPRSTARARYQSRRQGTERHAG